MGAKIKTGGTDRNRTCAGVTPRHLSSVLPYLSATVPGKIRREMKESNPRSLAAPSVFKTAALPLCQSPLRFGPRHARHLLRNVARRDSLDTAIPGCPNCLHQPLDGPNDDAPVGFSDFDYRNTVHIVGHAVQSTTPIIGHVVAPYCVSVRYDKKSLYAQCLHTCGYNRSALCFSLLWTSHIRDKPNACLGSEPSDIQQNNNYDNGQEYLDGGTFPFRNVNI